MPFRSPEYAPGEELLTTEVAFLQALALAANYDASNVSLGGGTQVNGERFAGPAATATLAHTPKAGTGVRVFRGGARQDPGGSVPDYTISGTLITLLSPLLAGEILLVDYTY